MHYVHAASWSRPQIRPNHDEAACRSHCDLGASFSHRRGDLETIPRVQLNGYCAGVGLDIEERAVPILLSRAIPDVRHAMVDTFGWSIQFSLGHCTRS